MSDFLTKPQPVMMISFLRNVERDSGAQPPDAVASRPFHLNEAITAFRGLSPSTMEPAIHLTQYLITAEPLKEANVEYTAEPTLFVSFSMALGY